MTPHFKLFIHTIALILFIIACLFTLQTCTSVTVKHPNGTEVSVRKFHPMGEELEVEGMLDDVGTLTINKTSNDSQAAVDAIVNGIVKAARP